MAFRHPAALHDGILHVYPQMTNGVGGFSECGSGGIFPGCHEPCLGPADILVACPWPNDSGHGTAPVGKIAAGLVMTAIELRRRDGQLQKVEKQQIPEIEPYLIDDAAGFRTPGAAIPAQFVHDGEQPPKSSFNGVRQIFGCPETAPVPADKSAQCHIGCLPLALPVGAGADRVEGHVCHGEKACFDDGGCLSRIRRKRRWGGQGSDRCTGTGPWQTGDRATWLRKSVADPLACATGVPLRRPTDRVRPGDRSYEPIAGMDGLKNDLSSADVSRGSAPFPV